MIDSFVALLCLCGFGFHFTFYTSNISPVQAVQLVPLENNFYCYNCALKQFLTIYMELFTNLEIDI